MATGRQAKRVGWSANHQAWQASMTDRGQTKQTCQTGRGDQAKAECRTGLLTGPSWKGNPSFLLPLSYDRQTGHIPTKMRGKLTGQTEWKLGYDRRGSFQSIWTFWRDRQSMQARRKADRQVRKADKDRTEGQVNERPSPLGAARQ